MYDVMCEASKNRQHSLVMKVYHDIAPRRSCHTSHWSQGPRQEAAMGYYTAALKGAAKAGNLGCTMWNVDMRGKNMEQLTQDLVSEVNKVVKVDGATPMYWFIMAS